MLMHDDIDQLIEIGSKANLCSFTNIMRFRIKSQLKTLMIT